jgi:pectin methylesterase-like acyl-CoA thioesterase
MLATKPGAGVVGLAMEELASGEAEIEIMVALGTYYQPQARIIKVAQSGGDYSSIADALASIDDASAQNHYIITVAPGEYPEQIVLKPFVEVIGMSANSVVVSANVAPVVTVDKDSRLEGVTVKLTGGANGNAILVSGDNNTAQANINDVMVSNDSSLEATAILVTGEFAGVNISDVKLTGSFGTGIAMISSSTLQISNSDFTNVIGSSLSVVNGLVNSRRNEYSGVLADVYVGVQGKVVSTNDSYKKVTSDGVMIDNSVAGKVDDSYVDYGWLAGPDANNTSAVSISAGAGSIAGAKVWTGVSQLLTVGQGVSYVLMTNDGVAKISSQATLASTTALTVAKVTVDVSGQMTISNDRTNEMIVAKEGGQYRTINDALSAITTNRADTDGRWWLSQVFMLKPLI